VECQCPQDSTPLGSNINLGCVNEDLCIALAGLIDVMRSTTQAFLAYMGSSWFDTLAICTVANNFAAEKGLALGLTKSLYGLSASLLTTAYENLFEPDVTQYPGFLTILIPGADLASRGDLVVA